MIITTIDLLLENIDNIIIINIFISLLDNRKIVEKKLKIKELKRLIYIIYILSN